MVKKLILISFLVFGYFAQAQVFFSDNFNDGNLDGWTNIDNDSDLPTSPGIDYNLWYASDMFADFVTGSDSAAAISHSQAYNGTDWIAFNPNNFLISPAIDLTSASSSNLKLKFESGSGQATGGHAEHYAVYVTTTNTIPDIEAATPVFEETLPSGEQMFSHIIDISSYSGQVIYVTFRHYNCTNQFNLLIDNVVVEHVLYDNASIESLSLNRYSLTNVDNTLSINVTNEGANNITSLVIDWNDGSSHSSTITGLNIVPFASDLIAHPTFVNYANVLEKEITVTITEVNGQTDPEMSGNTDTTYINTISQQSVKKVLFEEGTGTWCPGCPRGIVMMDNMTSAHPEDFIGIAVHIDDPMKVTEYQAASDFFAAPTMHVDRTYFDQDVDDAENLYNRQIGLDVPAELSATISSVGNDVTIETSVIFRTDFSNANLRLGVIIVEDHVTGTSSYYDQNNIYAGGSYGPMGGFENLPNPVPASQMEYNHVGRALLGGYSGQINSVPSSINDGDEITYTFNYTVPSTSNINNMHAVVVLIDQNTGEIVNAEADLSTPLTVESLTKIESNIYPNPASDILNIEFKTNGKDYIVNLFNIEGKSVYQTNISSSKDNTKLSISTNELSKGIYFINISSEGQSTTRKIIIN